MNAQSYEDELRNCIKQFELVCNYDCALLYSEELVCQFDLLFIVDFKAAYY